MAASDSTNTSTAELFGRQMQVLTKSWKLLPVILIVVGGLYAFYYKMRPRSFEAQAEIQYLFETPSEERISRLLGKLGIGEPAEGVIETQVKVIQSNALVEQTLEKLGLLSPETATEEKQRRVENFRRSLTVSPSGKTNILSLTARTDDAALSVRLLNTLIQVFQLHDTQQRRQSKVSQREYLLTELQKHERYLQEGRSLRTVVTQIEESRKELALLQAEERKVVDAIDAELARLETERAEMKNRFQPDFPGFALLERKIDLLRTLKTTGRTSHGTGSGGSRSVGTESHAGMEPRGEIKGVIFKDQMNGDRVRGAVVTTSGIADDIGGTVSYSDEIGAYRLDLPAGLHEIWVSLPGYKTARVKKRVVSDQTVWASLALQPEPGAISTPARIDGVVLGPSASPRQTTEGAQVSLPEGTSTPSDAQGRFSFDVPAGVWVVTARHSGQSGRSIVRVDWGERVDIRITADETAADKLQTARPEPAADLPVAEEWREWEARLKQLGRQVQSKSAAVEALRAKAQAAGLEPGKEDFYFNDLEINEEIYSNFKRQLAAVELALSDISSSVLILKEPTVPLEPEQVKLTREVPLVVALSLFLFVGLAFLLESINPTLSEIDDLESLGIHALGSIDYLPRRPMQMIKNPAELDEQERSQFEAFTDLCNMVKVNTELVIENRKPCIIMVSSCLAAEGKSTLALGLACTYAEAGYRTLLINANVRHPTLDSELGFESEPGLLDVLGDTITLEEAVREGPRPQLHFLPGHLKPHQRVRDGYFEKESTNRLMAELKRSYDVVLIDSPPLLMVSDALIIARKVDAVLMIYAAGQTPSHLFRRGVKLIQRTGTPLAGVILNRAKKTNSPRIRLGRYPNRTYPYHAGA